MKLVLTAALLLILAVSVESAVNQTKANCAINTRTEAYFLYDYFDLRTLPVFADQFAPTREFQGVRLHLNLTGQLQVWESATNVLLWSYGAPNLNCTGGDGLGDGVGCRAIFQSDGNFVVRYPGGQAIGSSTWDRKGAAIRLEPSPPYLSVVNINCTSIWPTVNTTNFKGPFPRTVPLNGPTTSLEVSTQSIPSASWKSHFGMNSHMGHGWNPNTTADMHLYVGTGIIRDSIPSPSNLVWMDIYRKLNAAGVKLNIGAGGAANKSVLASGIQKWSDYAAAVPGHLIQLEGFNEINNFGFNYSGYNKAVTAKGMAMAQQDLYDIIKADPNLKNLAVLDLTAGSYLDGWSWGLDDFRGHADFGCVHNYAYGGWPAASIDNVNNLFRQSNGGNYPKVLLPANQFAMTEIGYYTLNQDQGVSETAQGPLIVNTLLEGLLIGMKNTFIYELWDERWQGYEGPESHFGMFRNDRTPKPAARALHFLSELLSDPNGSLNAPSKTLNFKFDNLPQGAQHLLFQKSGGNFTLVIWRRDAVWNGFQDITLDPIQTTVTLASNAQFKVYPIFSTTADDTKPLEPSQVLNGRSFQVVLGNYPVAVGISGLSQLAPSSTSFRLDFSVSVLIVLLAIVF